MCANDSVALGILPRIVDREFEAIITIPRTGRERQEKAKERDQPSNKYIDIRAIGTLNIKTMSGLLWQATRPGSTTKRRKLREHLVCSREVTGEELTASMAPSCLKESA